jgi:uncharacterized cupredoxin-like copper-binding protein
METFERMEKHMIRKTRNLLAGAGLALAMAAPAFAAGDGHDHDHGHGTTPDMSDEMSKMHHEMEMKMADTLAFGRKGDPAQASRTVTIEATEIRFDLESLEAEVGETIRFVITNNGEQPHEFTIGDAAYQENAREIMAHMTEMGINMVSPEHAAMHTKAGNTVVVPVGETKEIAWIFTKPGAFEFSCNFVGHAEVGMVGTITVS